MIIVIILNLNKKFKLFYFNAHVCLIVIQCDLKVIIFENFNGVLQ